MMRKIKDWLATLIPSQLFIRLFGHRKYVASGKNWEVMGPLQYRFLLERGLQPHHVFVDVGCGPLRGGCYFIPYLETGHYLGMERERNLIELGIDKELGRKTNEEKKPEFVISENFEFSRFSKKADYALAQSLFSHLTGPDIEKCLRNLKAAAKPGCRFYVTFFEAQTSVSNPETSHPLKDYHYTRAEMETFGRNTGWKANYIGEWGHPHGQKMMEYVAEP